GSVDAIRRTGSAAATADVAASCGCGYSGRTRPAAMISQTKANRRRPSMISPYHGSRATPSPKSPRTGSPAQRAGPGAKPCATRDIAAARRSALAHLVARVGLVDDVHAPLAPHQTTVLV